MPPHYLDDQDIIGGCRFTVMNYDQTKSALTNILAKTEEIAQGIGLGPACDTIREISDKLERNFFYVAVLGQFKRGKSTFLNYILGTEILPSSVLPLTSVITKIAYSENISAMVQFEDNSSKEISLEDLSEYCTEGKNPKNYKQVKEIQVGYPFDFISHDTILIDTPGIASVYQHNTDVTYGFADKADAVIFMLSADPPISEAEKELIASLTENGSKLFFFLNKADYLEEGQLREVLSFNEDIIKEILNISEVKVFPVSALLALKGKIAHDDNLIKKSGVMAPVSEIEKYLAEKKNDILQGRFIRDTTKVLSMCETYLKSSLELRQMSVEEIQKKSDAFNSFMKDIGTRQHEFSVLFRDEMKRMMEELDERMASFRKEAGAKISDEIRHKYPDLRKLGKLKQEQGLKAFFGQTLIEHFEVYKKGIESDVEARYKQTLELYISRINDLIGKIAEMAEKTFGINLEAFQTPSGVTAPSRFTYRVNFDAGQIEIDPVYFSYLMPRPMAEKLILNRTLNRVDVDLDRNLGRVRYDILQRVDESFNEYSRWLNSRIEAMNTVVTKLAADASESAAKVRQGLESERANYQHMLDLLSAMESEIAT